MSAPLTARLDPETLTALDQLASRTERSRNWLVARAIEDYVALNTWQLDRIEAGIRAADVGDFASDEDVGRVLDRFAPKA